MAIFEKIDKIINPHLYKNVTEVEKYQKSENLFSDNRSIYDPVKAKKERIRVDEFRSACERKVKSGFNELLAILANDYCFPKEHFYNGYAGLYGDNSLSLKVNSDFKNIFIGKELSDKVNLTIHLSVHSDSINYCIYKISIYPNISGHNILPVYIDQPVNIDQDFLFKEKLEYLSDKTKSHCSGFIRLLKEIELSNDIKTMSYNGEIKDMIDDLSDYCEIISKSILPIITPGIDMGSYFKGYDSIPILKMSIYAGNDLLNNDEIIFTESMCNIMPSLSQISIRLKDIDDRLSLSVKTSKLTSQNGYDNKTILTISVEYRVSTLYNSYFSPPTKISTRSMYGHYGHQYTRPVIY